MRLTVGTWAWLAIASASVGVVHFDPWDDPGANTRVVAGGGVARRVFPGLADLDPDAATVELIQPNGTKLRFVPQGRREHHLYVGDNLIGPVDREAVDGLWSTLRMAMTVRPVSPGTELGAGQSGMVKILGSSGTMTLKLGLVAGDSSGVYATLEHEGSSAWVVEADLAALIEQPESVWLRRRLLEIEPADLASIAWENVVLTRGADDLWRISSGRPSALLSTAAVERRIEALFGANFEPVEDNSLATPDSLRPWMVLTTRTGEATKLALGGNCTASTRLVDRGPGRLGCIDADLAEPWNFDARHAGLVESRLVPYAYGRVLTIEQLEPASKHLRRQAGGWTLEQDGHNQVVSEPEVFRWFGVLRGVLVEPLEVGSPSIEQFQPDIEFVVHTDTTQRLHIRCQMDGSRPRLCTRDGGPPRRVITDDQVELAFRAETFADRALFGFVPSDAIALEILPMLGTDVVRQSVRQDFGLWRLDHPEHPDAAGAVDLVRVEGMLGTLAALRAEEWIERIQTTPLRTIRVELRAGAEGETGPVGIELFEGCLARVLEGRAVRLHPSSCEALLDDVLFDDPVRAWIDRAETIAVAIPAASSVTLRRDERREFVGDGEAAARVRARLDEWRRWRTDRLVQGDPPSSAQARVTFYLQEGVSVAIDIGTNWAQIADARWYYAMSPLETDPP